MKKEHEMQSVTEMMQGRGRDWVEYCTVNEREDQRNQK